ncbi:hypothetical protein QYF61_014636 [Mycteria americana]|uniref:Uncharacterized protein n=1 Tax=Mycteria americana TaxID=33587 RepID=A0AAN7S533_MYCAM|nr:hypothetical protein QYF61_014636 [Mycteria americana]
MAGLMRGGAGRTCPVPHLRGKERGGGPAGRRCSAVLRLDGDSTTALGSLFQCLATLSAAVESDEVSPQPPFLQAEQPQVPQPLPISLVLQTLPQLRCPSLDTLQPLNVSLVARGPTLNTAFEVRPHQCRVQGHDHCPTPAGHTIPDTSQDAAFNAAYFCK